MPQASVENKTMLSDKLSDVFNTVQRYNSSDSVYNTKMMMVGQLQWKCYCRPQQNRLPCPDTVGENTIRVHTLRYVLQGEECAWPWDYHCLSLTRIQFHPLNVTPLPILAEITVQEGLCYCSSIAWGWHNSKQSAVIDIDITDQLILLNGKKLRGVQEEQ